MADNMAMYESAVWIANDLENTYQNFNVGSEVKQSSREALHRRQ